MDADVARGVREVGEQAKVGRGQVLQVLQVGLDLPGECKILS